MSDYLKGTIANPDKIYGKSAYEIAVKYGYRGTEEEWSKEVEANRIATEEARNVAEEMRDRAVTASNGAATRADDAERSAQAAETSSLMAQEARDFATQAAKQAEQFADQIYKHLPGEEERVVAEEQRLTDEATRVANEAERVSSELSRDATFKGWANDIASLPSFDSRISANSDRLTNIEAGLPSSVWHVDDTAARVKDVPENARPKAIVSKIGGMTYRDDTTNTLRSAKVTEVKSVGVNLLHYASNSYSQNGVTVIVNADKSLTIKGTATSYVWLVLSTINLNIGQQYTVKATNCPNNAQFYLYHDDDGHFFRNSAYTFTAAQSDYGYIFAINPNETIDVTVYPMLNKGPTDKPYTPYVEHILPIPEELRPANGINAEVYDSIERNENGSVTKRVKCGEVDLGTLDWHYVASGNTRFDSYSLSGVLKKISSSSVANIICTKYEEVGTANQVYSGLAQIATTDGVIWICDTNYTDVATFKAAMSGVMLVYELAEPEVTDTYADLIIDVEGGGTLTFENEHGYDMPNTVTYMLKEVTA